MRSVAELRMSGCSCWTSSTLAFSLPRSRGKEKKQHTWTDSPPSFQPDTGHLHITQLRRTPGFASQHAVWNLCKEERVGGWVYVDQQNRITALVSGSQTLQEFGSHCKCSWGQGNGNNMIATIMLLLSIDWGRRDLSVSAPVFSRVGEPCGPLCKAPCAIKKFVEKRMVSLLQPGSRLQ